MYPQTEFREVVSAVRILSLVSRDYKHRLPTVRITVLARLGHGSQRPSIMCSE